MARSDKMFLLILAACLGLWGCTRVSATNGREGERIKFLEAKVAKLEDDFRAAATARDQWKQKMTALEQERAELQKQVPALTQERDDLRAQLAARTTERDALQAHYDAFRKEIRTLLGHADAAATQPNPQPLTTAPAPVAGRM